MWKSVIFSPSVVSLLASSRRGKSTNNLQLAKEHGNVDASKLANNCRFSSSTDIVGAVWCLCVKKLASLVLKAVYKWSHNAVACAKV